MMESTSSTLLGRLRDPTDKHAWAEFDTRYRPVLLNWCTARGLQAAEAHGLTQEALMNVVAAMRQFAYDPPKSFVAWLKSVWRNALSDLGRRRQGEAQAVGGSPTAEQMPCISDDAAIDEVLLALEGHFQRELLDEALERVASRVPLRDMEILRGLVFSERRGTQLADQHQISPSALSIIKNRTQALVRQEIARLRGDEVPIPVQHV